MLSVPPGYATLIWPPSGLALAAVILYGYESVLGIFFGAFLFNLSIVHGLSFETGIDTTKINVPILIAIGSTIQPVLLMKAISYLYGAPAHFKKWADLAHLIFIITPVFCFVASTIGVLSLYYGGIVSAENFWSNWVTWWFGDYIGIVLFASLILFLPVFSNRIMWKGRVVTGLTIFSIYALMIPLGITIYAWKASTQFIYEKNLLTFQEQVVEAEKALMHRIDSYEFALKGARGFFLGSDYVSPDEWREYVGSLDVEKNFIGINGIGWIPKVSTSKLPEFLAWAKENKSPDFKIHPDASLSPDERYVITYIEPEVKNKAAVGLDISFEQKRFDAANISRDTGMTSITKKITLVQDNEKNPGFLLLVPLYKKGSDTSTVQHRRDSLMGWIYAPFIAKRFMNDLVVGQGKLLQIRIYDGDIINTDESIYDSQKDRKADYNPEYQVTKTIDIKQNRWTLIYESTPAFEKQVYGYEPLLILIGGLLFTLLFGVFLYFLSRQSEKIQLEVTEKTQELSISEQRYNLAVKGMSAGLWDWNVVTGESFWSEQFRRILGISMDEIASDAAFMARIHPDDLDAVNADIQRHYSDGVSHDMQFRMRHEDGHFIWVHGSAQTAWNDLGAPVRMVGSITDISARKYAEDALIRSEELNNLAVRGMSVGLWDWNILTGEITTSYKLHELLGWNFGSEFVANFNDFVDRVHTDDIEKVTMALNNHLVNKFPYDVEYRLQMDNGGYIWLQACGQAKWDEDGKPTRMVGSIANIDARKRAEEKLIESNAELERFAYVASHDLQEPLRMVRNFTQILNEEYGPKFDAQAREYMGFIVNGATRMQYLVSDLLEYSRASKEELDMQDIECDSIMRAVEENLKSVLTESGGRIYYDKLPVVWANPIQLMRLMQNLVGNALKYRKKDVKPDVSVEVTEQDDHWLFSIADNGIGIKEEYLDQVFVLFKRLHRSSEYEGTGIGLAICKKVVEGMGGEIWVESEYGEGSIFYFTLPKSKNRGAV